jgi:type II secretory pathway pseudopilin PulG
VLIVAAVVVLAGVGVALWLTLGGGSSTDASSTTEATTSAAATSSGAGSSSSSAAPTTGGTAAGVPPATQPPTGLGNDPVENQYAQQCYRGDMASCDTLYIISDEGTPYSRYADTCAGRQPEGTDRLCEDTFPS